MKYTKYECNSYNIHTIKTDKFRTCSMEIIFRNEMTKDNGLPFYVLNYMLTYSNKNYPTRKDVIVKLEELYNASIRGSVYRNGKQLSVAFPYTFINPKYCEDNYLEDVISFPFDMILNPNIENDEFNKKIFKIIKNKTEANINTLKEHPSKYAFKRAIKAMNEESPSNYSILTSVEQLDAITPQNLLNQYHSLLNDFVCDIYVVGNLDMDEVVRIIKSKFKLHTIKEEIKELYIDNKPRKKEIITKEDSNFEQASFIVTYNTLDLTPKEKNVVMSLFNMILGSGGLHSKLGKSLREENSLCYQVTSIYNKYDNLLLVYAGISKESFDLALKLVKKAMKDMVDGNISDDEFNNNKLSLINSVKYSYDNVGGIITSYYYHNIANVPLYDEKMELIKSITKEEIIALAKKIKINSVYILNNGGNK